MQFAIIVKVFIAISNKIVITFWKVSFSQILWNTKFKINFYGNLVKFLELLFKL